MGGIVKVTQRKSEDQCRPRRDTLATRDVDGFEAFRRMKSLRDAPLLPPAPLTIQSSLNITPNVKDELRRYLLRVCYDQETFDRAITAGQINFSKQENDSLAQPDSVHSKHKASHESSLLWGDKSKSSQRRESRHEREHPR